MTITFCGHSDFCKTYAYESKILEILEETVGEEAAEIYLGGYGSFDSFAYECCKKYKKTHPNISLVFVTPYITTQYQESYLKGIEDMYDCIVYPEIEDKPMKFAIVYRNRYMVEKSDFVIAFVSRKYGGAYSTYKYAMRKGKTVLNLAELQ